MGGTTLVCGESRCGLCSCHKACRNSCSLWTSF